MVVIKIGGSLQFSSYMKKWIRSIELNFNNSFFLIFGGGEYADKVREDQKIRGLNDYEAHILAIKAMHKLTLDHLDYLNKFSEIHSLKNIERNYKKRKLFVWMPKINDIDNLDVSKNWDSTSDSISLAIAKKFNCPLIIVKSTNLSSKKFLNNFFLKSDLLDRDFVKLFQNTNQKISIVSKYNFHKLKEICKDFN
tara:strand:+ start:440 stop:1024 length:585 start_codon:yes stop_codon:yes gene_type:complete